MLRAPEVQDHLRQTSEIADTFEPHLYEVVFAESRDEV